MSYDKTTKAVNRLQAHRVTAKQKSIFLMHNDQKWLTPKMIGKMSKGKAMGCSCRICRGWDMNAKRDRLQLQLRKAGMERHDVRPDI